VSGDTSTSSAPIWRLPSHFSYGRVLRVRETGSKPLTRTDDGVVKTDANFVPILYPSEPRRVRKLNPVANQRNRKA
jgi:hypothetical protein